MTDNEYRSDFSDNTAEQSTAENTAAPVAPVTEGAAEQSNAQNQPTPQAAESAAPAAAESDGSTAAPAAGTNDDMLPPFNRMNLSGEQSGEYHFTHNQLYGNAAQQAPAYEIYVDPREEKKRQKKLAKQMRREQRKANRKGGAGFWTVLLCCVLSLACGFGGSFAYDELFRGGRSVTLQTVGSGSSQNGVDGETVKTLADVVDICKPSVVEVETEIVSGGQFFSQSVSHAAGSGVIITADGFIITNYHVISGASSISVTLSTGKQVPAALYGFDVDNDLAVLKITATGLTPAVFGDSSALRVGDGVIAIGNPLGTLGGSVTNGIISALDREITVEGTTMTLLQTNCAVNPGNSGGGLFNMNGELIGIVNAKSTGEDVEGLGFAISGNTAREISTAIIELGGSTSSSTPMIGITIINILDAETAEQYHVSRFGVYIADITEGYGAGDAGLRSGDYIVSVDNYAVSNGDDITAALKNHKAGDIIEIQVIRDDRIMSFKVRLMDRIN